MTTHTFEIEDPQRFAAAIEEFLACGIRFKASKGRIEVKLGPDVTDAAAEAFLHQAIEQYLARKRRSQAFKAVGMAHA